MSHVELLLYVDPGEFELIINMKRKGAGYECLAATIDTGAAISLFPRDLLDEIDHQPLVQPVIIDRAGIAGQSFEAVEAMVSLFLEDTKGNQTMELEVPCWFGVTQENLIGFAGLLDRATLFIDMRQTRTGWIEFDD